MLCYTVRRLAQFIPAILSITFILFILLNVLPGSAAYLSLDQRKAKDPDLVARLEKKWGLDQPFHIRYLRYLGNLAKGDLGTSFLRNERVGQMLAERIFPTLELALASMGIALGFGIPLGFLSALKKGSLWDFFSMAWAVSGISIPQFWLGMLLIFFFSVKIQVFPTGGYGSGNLLYLLLPAVSLGMGCMALIARTTRAAVLDVLNMDFLRTARSKGLSEVWIHSRHVLGNVLVLIFTTAGLELGSLMGSTVIVEKLFSWPGIGSLAVDSIYQRDIPVTQGCVLILVLIFLVLNLLVDLLCAWIDPRIRYCSQASFRAVRTVKN